MFQKPPLRLTRLIKQATAGGLAVSRLAEMINDANQEAKTGCRVTRQMVGNLMRNPAKVSLTWDAIVAFSTYFKKYGNNLQHIPILETRGVFEALGYKQSLVFMLGAKPRPEEQRTDVSQWDSEANAELRAHASLHGIERTCNVQHVLWRSPLNTEAIQAESWYRILEEDQSSVISIGSPLASLSSEVMLSRALGAKPFDPPDLRTGRPLPFYFVWLHKIASGFRSAFGLTHRELQPKHRELAGRVERNESTAFILGDDIHESPANGNEWTMYGIIAAQRRAAGNIWLVVAGLHGPATYGAALMVKELVEELPWTVNRPSKILWVPVKVLVRARDAKPTDGDVREVVHTEFDGKPRFWPDEE